MCIRNGKAVVRILSVVFITVMFLTYGCANTYIALRLYQWLKLLFPQMTPATFACIFALIAASVILGFLPIPSGIKRTISWISAYWMGIYVYSLIFCLAADCIVLLGSLFRIIPGPLPQSVLFFRGLAAFLLTAGVVSYGIFNANQIKIVNYDITLYDKTPPYINDSDSRQGVDISQTGDKSDPQPRRNTEPVQKTMKIVLISDLHLGAVNSERNLEKVVRRVNSLKPDIVCIAGDVFNGDINALKNPSKAMDLFLEIEAEYGVYASLGNHDGGKTYDEMVRFLSQSNIKLLNDDYEIIDGRLVLLGRIDPSPIGGFGDKRRSDIAGILSGTDTESGFYTDLPVVVMDHNPANTDQYGSDVDVVLSGHTHRGQVFPGSLITRAMFSVDYGYRHKTANSPHIVVTSGAGTWGTPMRVGSNSEVVSIKLSI